MEPEGFLLITPLYDFVFNILIILYRALGENLGLALIAIAILSRVVVIPFTIKQLKNVDKNKEFQAKYEQIKKKYKNNKDQQSKELAKLQGQYLPGQLSGCLTLIVQLLLLIQINHVIKYITSPKAAEHFNNLAYSFVDKFAPGYEFDLHFLGNLLNLGQSAQDQGISNFEKSWPYLALAVFLVVTQYFSMKIMTGLTKSDKDREKEKLAKIKSKKTKKDDDEVPSFSEVFSSTNKQMAFFFPVLLGFFSLNYASGLSLYFATTSLFVIIQQMVMKRKEIVNNLKTRYFVEKDQKDKIDSAKDKAKSPKKKSNSKSKKIKKKKGKK